MNSDLISREALKKSVNDELERLSCVLYKNNDYYLGVKRTISTVLNFINNAPTVEPEKALIANVTFDEDKLKEIVQTEVIDKIKSGEIVIKDERPQEKWKDHSEEGYVECPICGHLTNCEDNIDELHYCWNCGAKMKGGAE